MLALQFLDFLIKNGSEQVIDDARSHLYTLKMLSQFHFIDLNGKDQGINVRNRAKELAELLSDVDRIRTECKKARAMKNKYGGVEGEHSTVEYGVRSAIVRERDLAGSEVITWNSKVSQEVFTVTAVGLEDFRDQAASMMNLAHRGSRNTMTTIRGSAPRLQNILPTQRVLCVGDLNLWW
ncbi:Epsin-3, clathrin recruitment and traffic between the Golgi and endosome [Rhizina undulata]